MFIDLRLLDKGVENVQDRVGTPDLALGKHIQLLLRLVLDLGAPHAEGLELIDELVDNVP
jgi:hypothetical protein